MTLLKIADSTALAHRLQTERALVPLDMLHASTSPFYPLFAALEINAKIHEGSSGRRMWMDCVKLGIETRKPFAGLATYLRENGIVPEKCDLNSILFLITPAEDAAKMRRGWWMR